MKKITYSVASECEAVGAMLRREFRAMQKADHPNIIELIGVCLDQPNSAMLLMELSRRGSLRGLLNATPEVVVGNLPVQTRLLFGIASGMAFLHDLTPPM